MSYDIDDSGTVVWQLALCLFLTWFIIFIVLIKGVGSLGKVDNGHIDITYHLVFLMPCFFVANFRDQNIENRMKQTGEELTYTFASVIGLSINFFANNFVCLMC